MEEAVAALDLGGAIVELLRELLVLVAPQPRVNARERLGRPPWVEMTLWSDSSKYGASGPRSAAITSPWMRPTAAVAVAASFAAATAWFSRRAATTAAFFFARSDGPAFKKPVENAD